MSAFSKQYKWLGQLSHEIAQEEWLGGIDIYRENRILKVQRFEHLICGTIKSLEGKNEVRVKVHPNGKMLQWVECTCLKNRKKGIYCEHIAGLLFYIQQEQNRESVESSSPLNQKFMSSSTQDHNLVHRLFQQGRGNIVKIEIQKPNFIIHFEVKTGELSSFELDVDHQAAFLESLADIERNLVPLPFRTMKLIDKIAVQGLYFYMDSSKTLIANKVLALKMPPKKNLPTEIEYFHKKLRVLSREQEDSTFYQLFPEDALSPWVGKQHFAIPGIGYFKIDNTFETWSDLASKSKINDETSIDLFSNQFLNYRKLGPVFLDSSVSNIRIVNDLRLSEIRVLHEKDGWFYLDPRYMANGKEIGISDFLKNFSKNNKEPFLKRDKLWIRIPDVIKNTVWNVDSKEKCLKLNNLDLVKFKQSLNDVNKLTGKESVLKKIRAATEFNTPNTTPSLSHTNLNLRDYQKFGFEWLWWLYSNELHGLLADDMGLGKTHQAMAVMSAIQASTGKTNGPMFLCVCPTTVLDHWIDKIETFAPNLRPIKYYGSKRELLVKSFANYNTVLTSYGVLLRDLQLFENYNWEVVLLDEAHFVKNNKTATYKAACRLNGKLRLCLSGTPIENRLNELKNIFDFIVPGYFGTDREFNKNFVVPIETHKVDSKEQELLKLIAPLKLRRTKEQVLKDLPEKIEDTRHCWLSNDQIALYKDVLSAQAIPLLDSLKNSQSSIPYLHIFTVLQVLKQICNHPAMIRKSTDWRDGESGKFELFKTLLSEALDSNHKIVIYSQYLQMIEIIKNYLTELKIEHVVLTGQSQKRGQIIEKFQTDPNVKVFVGSLRAGGLGIDLTAASVVIHYDRWWNSSKENQATDRVHRIGQKNFTQVIKLVTRGTLEEKIDKIISQKASLFNRFLESDKEAFRSFTREELINLLQ
jgi:SNF2 family DNA or RNA helicase